MQLTEPPPFELAANAQAFSQYTTELQLQQTPQHLQGN
jgi:hypothetical protein